MAKNSPSRNRTRAVSARGGSSSATKRSSAKKPSPRKDVTSRVTGTKTTQVTKPAAPKTRATSSKPALALQEHPLFAGIIPGPTEAAERAARQRALAQTLSHEMERRGLSEAEVVSNTELPADVVRTSLTGIGQLPPRYALLAVANATGVDLDRAIDRVLSTLPADRPSTRERRDLPIVTERPDGLVEVVFLRPLILPPGVVAKIREALAGGD